MNLIEDLRRSIYELMKKNNMTCQEFGDALGYPVTDVDRILFGVPTSKGSLFCAPINFI